MRKVIVMLEVDDNKATEENLGTIEYVERECGWLSDSGIYLQNARILDYDDRCDTEAIKLANKIFEGNIEEEC